VLRSLDLLGLVVACAVSDAAQFLASLGYAGKTSPCYTRGSSLHRTAWAGIRGTNRLYQRRLNYRQLDLRASPPTMHHRGK
jgi:hypothetical protein